MEFRRAVESDANSIMDIIGQAQYYFKEHGIDQWQNNYPNFDTVKNDINNKNAYVLLKDSIVVGTAAIIFDGEKNYKSIYNGKWISNGEYAAIHRIAVDTSNKGLGLGSVILKNAEEICLGMDIHSIRVDTHKENIPMQRLLYKNGFKYCGIIYIEDSSERMAFEKVL